MHAHDRRKKITLIWPCIFAALLAGAPPVYARQSTPAQPAIVSIDEAYQQQRSRVIVETTGTVYKVLRDDLKGRRHQRFILRLDTGHTVLIAYNLDLAPRVPVHPGDTVTVHGEYVWNDKGGIIHWTHRDPSGRRPGGWIRLGEQIYR